MLIANSASWPQASMPAGSNCAAAASWVGGLGCRHRCLLVKIVLQAHRCLGALVAGIGACCQQLCCRHIGFGRALQASVPAGKNCAAGTSPWGGLGCRHRCLLVRLHASMPANKNCAAGTWPWGNLGCRHRCLLVKTVLQAPYPVWAFKDLKRGRGGVGVPGEHTLSIVIKTSLQTVCHHGGIHNVRGCCGCCWLWLHRRAFTAFTRLA